MTGRNPNRYGIGWAGQNPLPREELTIGEVLQAANYRTGFFGKWHLGKLTPERDEGFPGPKLDAKQGLKAEYFSARGFQGNKRVIDRIDPQVKFDFGKAAPEGGKFDAPHTFAIRWEGSVTPPESGVYEFVVRTEHATKLFVNDNKTPLIDAWVKSGKDTEFRGTVHLLAGRAVPLRLEFSKAKQGVDDSKKNPNPPLLPKEPKARARVRAIAQIIAADTHPLIVPRVREYLAHAYKIDEPGVLKWGNHWHNVSLKALETVLSGSRETGRYCQGDQVTIADICLAGQAAGASYFKADLAPFPTVKRIVDEVNKIDAFARAHPLKQPGAPASA